MSEHVTGKWSGPTGARPKPQPVAEREARIQAAREVVDKMEEVLRMFNWHGLADQADIVREALR